MPGRRRRTLRWLTGRIADVRDWFERAGALARHPTTRPSDRGRLLYPLGQTRQLVGDAEGSADVLTEAIDVLEQAGEDVGLGAAHIVLSATLPRLGRHEEADGHIDAGLTVAERIGEAHLLGYATAMLGTALTVAGDLAAARALHRRQLEAARRVGFRILDDPDTAMRLLAAAEGIRDRLQLVSWPRFAPVHDAMVAEATRRLGDAAARAVASGREADPWMLMARVRSGRRPTAPGSPRD